MELAVHEILNALNGTYDSEPADTTKAVRGVTWDSRTVEPGMLYVCLPGERVDGHSFAASAIAAGAACVLAMHQLDEAALAAARSAVAAVIRVADTQAALTQLAGFWRTRLQGRVIGLTGSTGKTTTKNLVRTVLASAASCVATEANQNNELGVPRTLLRADADTSAVVVEMGMRGLGQIAELCSFVKPDWGIVTNVGESHIELLGSRDNIARAKAELFEALPEGGTAFVNAADDYASELVKIGKLHERGVNVVFFLGNSDWQGEDGLCVFDGGFPFVWATDIKLDELGCPSFIAHALGFAGCEDVADAVPCKLQLAGVHNVSNACSAIAVGMAAGLTLEACIAALEDAQPEKGRQQVHCTDSGLTVVDDAYNANPDSMKASLATFANMGVDGKRVAVLGDMGELGDFAPECHERVGGFAANANLDELLCVGELSRLIAQSACDAGMDAAHVTCVDTVEQALDKLHAMLAPGDAVLAKASHFMEFERIVEGLVK